MMGWLDLKNIYYLVYYKLDYSYRARQEESIRALVPREPHLIFSLVRNLNLSGLSDF